MENNQNPQTQLALEQMQTYSIFIDSINRASEALISLSEFLPHLDFTNHNMIQKYYESLSYFARGMNSVKLGFHEYAASHQIELQDI